MLLFVVYVDRTSDAISLADCLTDANRALDKRCAKPSRTYCRMARSDSHLPSFMITFTGTPQR